MKKCCAPIVAGLMMLLWESCVVAPTSPMVSLGSPEPLGKNTIELAAAAGAGLAITDKPRGSEMGWYGRLRYGITPKMDLGVEGLGFIHDRKWTMTSKLSTRYTFTPWFRADIGAGVADNTYGRAIAGDVGLTFGSSKQENVWNPYGTLRYGYSYGMRGSTFGPVYGDLDIGPLVNAHSIMLNVGAEGKLTQNLRMMFEGGFGQVFPAETRRASIIYLTAGFAYRLPLTKN